MKRCWYNLVVFSETTIRGKSKGKRKGCGWRKKRIEKGVYHDLLQDMRANDRESHSR